MKEEGTLKTTKSISYTTPINDPFSGNKRKIQPEITQALWQLQPKKGLLRQSIVLEYFGWLRWLLLSKKGIGLGLL